VKEKAGWHYALFISLFFVLGLSTTFVTMGIIAVALGKMFGDIGGGFWKYVIAAICLLMALHLFDVKFLQFKGKKKIGGTRYKGRTLCLPISIAK